MQYPVYQKDKPSRFDRAILLPQGWDEKRLKFVVSHNDESLPETTDADYEIEYVDISSVDLVHGITNCETVSFEKAPSRARRIARDGDTIVSTVRTYLKAIAPINNPPDNLVVSTGFAVIRPRENVYQRYLSYFLQSQNFVELVVANSVGVSYPAINPSALVCIPVSFPENVEEQQKIAAFLDYKTQQIDELIEKKKNLIEKLEEKRTAVITQAVTKGLDKNSKLKSSGVDWLGDVPEHWNIVKFKYFIGYQEGPGIMAVDFREEGVPLLRIRNVQSETISMDGCNFLDPDKVEKVWDHFRCKEGDLIISGSASTGLVSEVNGDSVGSVVYTGLIRLWPYSIDIEKEFIRLLVSSELFFSQIDQLKTGSTIQHFGPDHLRQMLIMLPPIEEQLPIVESARSEISHTEKMLDKTREAIAKLEEYRSAMITSAVTGKIDVREVEVPREFA